MGTKKTTKRMLLVSCLSVVVCVALLVGSTFAWFNASVTNSGNKIEAGTLNISLLEKQADGTYSDISSSATPLFNYDKWEPGFTAVRELQLRTTGTLALRYQVVIKGLETLDAATTKNIQNVIDVTVNNVKIGTLADFVNGTSAIFTGTMIPAENKTTANLNIQLHMQEAAGNEYQGALLPAFDIQIDAAQYTYETDDLNGNQYDATATPNFDLTRKVNHVYGTETKVIDETGLTVTVDGAQPTNQITATVKVESVVMAEALTTVNLDISVKDSNGTDVPSTIVFNIGKNLTDVRILHSGVEMAASDYTYDAVAGTVTIRCTTYSPYSATYLTPTQTEKLWRCSTDTSWYTGHESDTEYTLNTAQQLAGLANLVNAGNTFSGKTVTLGADIDLSGKEWTPIGSAGKTPFSGTFSGGTAENMKTVSNIQVKNATIGGLFGLVSAGNVQNLLVKDVTISSGANGRAGGLCGLVVDGTVINCNVIGGTIRINTLIIKNGQYATMNGGLIGGASGATVTDCTLNPDAVIITNTGDGTSTSINGGFIGFVTQSSTVSSCGVKNVTINSLDEGYNGGFAGSHYGSKISNCYVENCKIDTPKPYIVDSTTLLPYNGGFVGIIGTKGVIDGSCQSNNCTIIAGDEAYCGGFAGMNIDGQISDACSAKECTITSGANSINGGFVGRNGSERATITGCSVIDFSVTGGANSTNGGFVGENYNSTVTGACAAKDGSVNGSESSYNGGFAGLNKALYSGQAAAISGACKAENINIIAPSTATSCNFSGEKKGANESTITVSDDCIATNVSIATE